MASPKINGRYYDWSSIEITLEGMSKDIASEIVEISYEEKDDIKHRFGKGRKPKGYSIGNSEFTGKIVFNNEGFDAFMEIVKSQGYEHPIQLPPVNINIHYLNDEGTRTITDVLEDVKFHSPKKSPKQGDTELTTEMELLIMNIKYNA